jgi:hypothetical protein
MTNATRSELAQWSTILDLSQRMLELAQVRDWQSLESLMTAREKLLPLYFVDDVAPARATELQEHIRVIQDNDRLIVELTQINRELLADELLKLQKARQLVSHYQQQLQRVIES